MSISLSQLKNLHINPKSPYNNNLSFRYGEKLSDYYKDQFPSFTRHLVDEIPKIGSSISFSELNIELPFLSYISNQNIVKPNPEINMHVDNLNIFESSSGYVGLLGIRGTNLTSKGLKDIETVKRFVPDRRNFSAVAIFDIDSKNYSNIPAYSLIFLQVRQGDILKILVDRKAVTKEEYDNIKGYTASDSEYLESTRSTIRMWTNLTIVSEKQIELDSNYYPDFKINEIHRIDTDTFYYIVPLTISSGLYTLVVSVDNHIFGSLQKYRTIDYYGIHVIDYQYMLADFRHEYDTLIELPENNDPYLKIHTEKVIYYLENMINYTKIYNAVDKNYHVLHNDKGILAFPNNRIQFQSIIETDNLNYRITASILIKFADNLYTTVGSYVIDGSNLPTRTFTIEYLLPSSINDGIYTLAFVYDEIRHSNQMSYKSIRYYSLHVISIPPIPVATTDFGTLLGSGTTTYEWLTGVSGANLTREGVSTFDNRGVLGENRTGEVTYSDLILQAKAGDSLRFIARIGVESSTVDQGRTTRLWINLGSGTYTLINIIDGRPDLDGEEFGIHDYTVPTGTPAGNYAIAVTIDFVDIVHDLGYFRTTNYYSLHVF